MAWLIRLQPADLEISENIAVLRRRHVEVRAQHCRHVGVVDAHDSVRPYQPQHPRNPVLTGQPASVREALLDRSLQASPCVCRGLTL
jgi:hypothetical protein